MVIGDWEQTRGEYLKVGDVISVDYFFDYSGMVICTVEEMDNFNLYVEYIHPNTNEVMCNSLKREYLYWRLND